MFPDPWFLTLPESMVQDWPWKNLVKYFGA